MPKQKWRHGTPTGYTNGCKCPECLDAGRAYHREYHARNREKRNAKTAKWRANHPDYDINRYRSDRESKIERVKRYRKTEAGRIADRATVQRRRARKHIADCGCVTKDSLANVMQLHNGLCVYCGKHAEHADHVEPIAKGGLHCVSNLVPACASCNQSKGAKGLSDWMQFIPTFDIEKRISHGI